MADVKDKKDEMVQVRRVVEKDGKKKNVTLPYRREIADRLVSKGLGTIIKITITEEPVEVPVEEVAIKADEVKENDTGKGKEQGDDTVKGKGKGKGKGKDVVEEKGDGNIL